MKTATALGNWWLEASSQQCGPLMYHVLCRVFWPNIKSSRSLSPHTAQIWCPMTSGFSQNYNHLWKGIAFRPSMRFRKIQQDSWQWFQQRILQCFEQWKRHWENCVRSQGAYFKGDWGIIVLCTLFLVSYIFFKKGLYFLIVRGWILSGQTLYLTLATPLPGLNNLAFC